MDTRAPYISLDQYLFFIVSVSIQMKETELCCEGIKCKVQHVMIMITELSDRYGECDYLAVWWKNKRHWNSWKPMIKNDYEIDPLS